MTWQKILPHGNKGIPEDKVSFGPTKLTIHRATVAKMNCTHVQLLFDTERLMIGLAPTNEEVGSWSLTKTGRNYAVNIGTLMKGYNLEKYTKATYPIKPPGVDNGLWTISLKKEK